VPGEPGGGHVVVVEERVRDDRGGHLQELLADRSALGCGDGDADRVEVGGQMAAQLLQQLTTQSGTKLDDRKLTALNEGLTPNLRLHLRRWRFGEGEAGARCCE